jgi:hypothetical protein
MSKFKNHGKRNGRKDIVTSWKGKTVKEYILTLPCEKKKAILDHFLEKSLLSGLLNEAEVAELLVNRGEGNSQSAQKFKDIFEREFLVPRIYTTTGDVVFFDLADVFMEKCYERKLNAKAADAIFTQMINTLRIKGKLTVEESNEALAQVTKAGIFQNYDQPMSDGLKKVFDNIRSGFMKVDFLGNNLALQFDNSK